MKKNLAVIVVMLLCMAGSVYAQEGTADVTLSIKGIKEAKGSVMVAIGDMQQPESLRTAMVQVTETGEVTCVVKGVPVGKTTLNVFQDLDGNFSLNTDEGGIPTEPCNTKEVKLKEGENAVSIQLLNIKEMMGGANF